MFACLYSLSAPLAALIKLAEDFTPRFEVVGPLVMLDISGLSQLFGSPRDIGEQLRRSAGVPVRIAIASTQTAAALLVLGRPGLTVVAAGEQHDALAPLPVTLLGEFDRLRLTGDVVTSPVTPPPAPPVAPPNVADMEDVLPYFQSSLSRTSEAAAAPHRTPMSGGWMHPRDSHAAAQTRRSRRPVTTSAVARERLPASFVESPLTRPAHRVSVPRDTEHAHVARQPRGSSSTGHDSTAQSKGVPEIGALQATVRRWGVKTFGELAVLPPGEIYERLGARGVLWQRLARGEDSCPLVPWVPEDPFEGSLDLEWPIEGLEPLSFVLGRLFEPLSERLERADRGAAILHTHLRLVDKTVHARTLQLPAPMRDPKTLRTLVLLDLESNPPAAAIDGVRVLAEPTPARVTQWALFDRAQPSPEQVSTLLARLSALMGDSHVGAPQLVDSWKPGAFTMHPFAIIAAASGPQPSALDTSPSASSPPPSALRTPHSALSTSQSALRRFRLPVPARVHVHEGRPVKIMTDRRGVIGGQVVEAAGPWRTSGEWWNDNQAGRAWDRDEWDVAIADGTVYRIYVERESGHWFLEGIVD